MRPGLRSLGRTPHSFAEFERRWTEGADFVRSVEERDGPILVAAPHGGGIEPGSSEIARALAGRAHSFYALEGIRPFRNDALHLTSTLFDDPVLLAMAAKARIVVSVHGCAGREPALFLGGRHEELRSALIDALATAGFPAQRDREDRSGSDPRNLCNRGSCGRGVQLEISLGLRRLLFAGLRRAERESTTAAFGDLIATLQGVLARVAAVV